MGEIFSESRMGIVVQDYRAGGSIPSGAEAGGLGVGVDDEEPTPALR